MPPAPHSTLSSCRRVCSAENTIFKRLTAFSLQSFLAPMQVQGSEFFSLHSSNKQQATATMISDHNDKDTVQCFVTGRGANVAI